MFNYLPMKMKNTKPMIGLLGLIMLLSINAKAQLLWADEFSGTSVNTSNWGFDTGAGGWGNSELEYYRSQNATVSGGYLNITAKRESYGGAGYTSARVKTQGKKSWTYGYMESSIKMPKGQGLWPAFWMIGDNISSVGWPKCGELDIMEHVNSDGTITGTMHWDIGGSHVLYNAQKSVDVSGWHKYQMNWNATSIKWYVDGSLYLTGNIANNINDTEEFHRPFFFILNVAVGGNWPGSPNSSTPFPAVMQVDYVRVYQAASGRLGVDEEVANTETEVRILQNPVKETLSYTVPNELENHVVKMYDLQGKEVLSNEVKNAKGINSINVSSVKPGYYVLDVYNGGVRKKLRVLKD
jgi:beta-glucanase (GH16 family)